MGRFSPNKSATERAADDAWNAMSERIYDEFELEEYDKKLADFNFLRSKKDLESYYVHIGACHWGFGPYRKHLIYLFDAKFPQHLLVDRANQKIAQWSKWREAKFPASRVRDYARMAREGARKIAEGYDLGELASEFEHE